MNKKSAGVLLAMLLLAVGLIAGLPWMRGRIIEERMQQSMVELQPTEAPEEVYNLHTTY